MSRRSKPALGSGERFKDLSQQLAHRSGVKDPKALAAYIGTRKYGKDKMQTLAEKGRK